MSTRNWLEFEHELIECQLSGMINNAYALGADYKNPVCGMSFSVG